MRKESIFSQRRLQEVLGGGSPRQTWSCWRTWSWHDLTAMAAEKDDDPLSISLIDDCGHPATWSNSTNAASSSRSSTVSPVGLILCFKNVYLETTSNCTLGAKIQNTTQQNLTSRKRKYNILCNCKHRGQILDLSRKSAKRGVAFGWTNLTHSGLSQIQLGYSLSAIHICRINVVVQLWRMIVLRATNGQLQLPPQLLTVQGYCKSPPKKDFQKRPGRQSSHYSKAKLPKVNEAPLSRHAAEPQACFFSK